MTSIQIATCTASEAVDVETDPVHFCSNLVESLARNQAALVGEIVATLCSEGM